MPASRIRKTAAAIEAMPPPTSQTWLVAGSRWELADMERLLSGSDGSERR